MLELLRQKRPWQVWAILADLVIAGPIVILSSLRYLLNDSMVFDLWSPGWKIAISAFMTLPVLTAWLLLHARRAGKNLYVVYALCYGGLGIWGILRLYCAFCGPSSLHIAAGEVAADEARRARGVKTCTPFGVWASLWLWAVCEMHVIRGVGSMLRCIEPFAGLDYAAFLAVECLVEALRYLIWMGLLWAALVPRRPLRQFFSVRLLKAALLFAALQAGVYLLWGLAKPAVFDAPELVQVCAAACKSLIDGALVPLTMFAGWSLCVRRGVPARGYLKNRGNVLAVVGSFALAASVGLLAYEHPIQFPELMTGAAIPLVSMKDTGISIYQAPVLVEAYFPTLARLLLWCAFRRFENRAASAADTGRLQEPS